VNELKGLHPALSNAPQCHFRFVVPTALDNGDDDDDGGDGDGKESVASSACVQSSLICSLPLSRSLARRAICHARVAS